MEIVEEKVEQAVLLSEHASDESQIELSSSEFKNHGLTDVTKYFSKETAGRLSEEMQKIFDDKKQRKDFLSKHTDGTPRHMFSINEMTITEVGTVIPEFYYSAEVKNLIHNISHDQVFKLPWEGERYVINGLVKRGDTHGWHWDDYTYSLIYIAKTPDEDGGGLLECVPNVLWNKENPQINKIINEHKLNQYYFPSGTFYLMKSDTTLHRVMPLEKDFESIGRLAMSMSWSSLSDLNKEIDHETVYELYGRA